MFAHTRTEHRLLGFDIGDWSILVVGFALVALLNFAGLGAQSSRHHRTRGAIRREHHTGDIDSSIIPPAPSLALPIIRIAPTPRLWK